MRPPAESRATGRSVQLLLAALLLWAAVLRVWAALPNPTSTRFWDERYSVANVVRVAHGSFEPANGYHPSLSYLPHALVVSTAHLLHERLGRPAAVLAGEAELTPLGYHLCRLTQVALGLSSIWLLYLLGRRVFDPTVGLVAAFLFAAVPWHLRQSVIFKPDVLLLATGILALLASVAALERPSLRRFASAGAAIGLCLASKFNAAPFAVPLALGGLWHGVRRDRRALLWLLLAGAVAVAVLLLLDPWLALTPDLYRRSFGGTLRDYARKGESAGLAAWELPVHAVATLLRPTFHGPWLGVLALAAVVALAASLLPRPSRGLTAGRLAGRAVLAGFFLVYVLAYSVVTRNPSPHNWLMLTPVTSLAAGWALVEAARWAVRRRPALGRLAPAAAVLLVAAASWPPLVWAYREAVPTTVDVAEAELLAALPPTAGSLVLTEAPLRPALLGPARQKSIKRRALERPLVLRVPHLPSRPAAELSQVDALVFPAERLRDPAYGELVAGEGRRVVRVSAAPLRRRGAGLVVVLQPLELAGARQHRLGRSAGRTPLVVPVTGLEPGRLVSIQVAARGTITVAVENGGVEVPCLASGEERVGFLCSTPKFRPTEPVRLRAEGAFRNGAYQVMSWHPPE